MQTMTPQEAPIVLELSPPYCVNGMPTRYQSLWLLARIVYAQQVEMSTLSAALVRAQFSSANTIRMVISRAFTDFTRWQIAVGWGRDQALALTVTYGNLQYASC